MVGAGVGNWGRAVAQQHQTIFRDLTYGKHVLKETHGRIEFILDFILNAYLGLYIYRILRL